MALQAKYKKLRDGSYGAKVLGEDLRVGDEIVVTRANGESDIRTVQSIVWTGQGDREEEAGQTVSICILVSDRSTDRTRHVPPSMQGQAQRPARAPVVRTTRSTERDPKPNPDLDDLEEIPF